MLTLNLRLAALLGDRRDRRAGHKRAPRTLIYGFVRQLLSCTHVRGAGVAGGAVASAVLGGNRCGPLLGVFLIGVGFALNSIF